MELEFFEMESTVKLPKWEKSFGVAQDGAVYLPVKMDAESFPCYSRIM